MIVNRQLVSVFQQQTPATTTSLMRLKIPLTMDEVIGGIDAEITDVEEALLHQIGAKEVPFAGMDKSGRGVCLKY
ncbi:unnamed protein product, partial [Strongylus vulgaris]